MLDTLLYSPRRLGFLRLIESMLSKWSGVHPYVTARVRRILDVADHWGGRYTVTSGVRPPAEQREIWLRRRGVGVARPGCSQHQYGLAMDVHFEDQRWQDWFRASARQLGLSTVTSSRPHVQAVPGSTWSNYASSQWWCPWPGM